MKRRVLFVVGLICALAAGAIILGLYRGIQAGDAVPMPRLIIGLALAATASLSFRLARR